MTYSSKECIRTMKKHTDRIFLAVVIVILMVTAGCGGQSDTGSDSTDNDEGNGRIIVPEADWTPADEDSEEAAEEPVVDSDGDGVENEEVEIRQPADAVGNVELVNEINIEVYINGEKYEFGQPFRMHQGQAFETLIRISSTIFEVTYFWVSTSDTMSEKYEGELAGYEAELTYEFTYNYSTWEEGGISIAVLDQLGSVTMKNVLLIPADPMRPPG